MSITQLIEIWILPPGLIFLLLAFALFVARYSKKTAWFIATANVFFFYLLSTSLVSTNLMEAQNQYPFLEKNQLTELDAQAIIILAGGSRANAQEYQADTVSRYSLERARYGAELHRVTGLPILLTGGVLGAVAQPESVLMQQVLEESFHLTAKWLEKLSRNTEENAKYSSAMLQKEGVNKVFLVTHAWHMPRAVMSFNKYGLEIVPAPMGVSAHSSKPMFELLLPSIASLQKSTLMLREIVGRFWYDLRY